MIASILGSLAVLVVIAAIVIVGGIVWWVRSRNTEPGLLGRVGDVARAQAGDAVRGLELDNAAALRRQQREDALKAAKEQLVLAQRSSQEDQLNVTRQGVEFKRAAEKVNKTTNEIATLQSQARQIAADAEKPNADAELTDAALAVAGEVVEAEARLEGEKAERDRLQAVYNRGLEGLKTNAAAIRKCEALVKELTPQVAAANRPGNDGGAGTKGIAERLEETIGHLQEEIEVVNENANTGMIVEGRNLKLEQIRATYAQKAGTEAARAKLDQILGKKPAAPAAAATS